MDTWIYKKPLWPFLVTLVCLFVMAVTTPSSWQRDSSPSSQTLEKGVEQDLRKPEYSAWDSGRNVAESIEATLSKKLGASKLGASLGLETPSADLAPDAFLLDESLPTPQDSDLGILQQVRDKVRSIVDRLPDQEQSSRAAAPKHQVRVDSEHDRLAMRDTDPHRDQEGQRPVVQTIRHRPNRLFKQLETLSDVPEASSWSKQVLARLQQITEESLVQIDTTAIIHQLRSLVEEGNDLAAKVSHPATQQDWLQANQALERRLELWQVLLDPRPQEVASADVSSLTESLKEITALLSAESSGNDWNEYLLLDRFAAALSEGVEFDAEGVSKLAFKVLSRMSDRRLSEAQAKFLATPPLLKLHQHLQPLAARSIDIDRLIALVERYEAGRELRYASAIARVQQQLRWSDDARYRALGEHLDQHYRSSNMRIAFSAELLNRMMPERKSTVAPVRDRIAGAKIRGKSLTTTDLKVSMLPDPSSWQFSLEASGDVTSKTQSQTWPARVRNTAKMQYQAKKVVVIGPRGLRISPAQSSAQGHHNLTGVDSQLDPLPLAGHLLREIARKKNHKSRFSAMSQVKSKVAREARQRMDQEADPKLSNLERQFRNKVLAPIGQLALVADSVAMTTTTERAVMQLLLANNEQLGAHTPRPLAPSDSVISMQMHETSLNNALAGLALEGRRMKLPELYRFFAGKFGKADSPLPEDLSARAVIEFAARDAILVSCDGDRLNLVLSIREMAHGRDKIRNFQVHANFRPVLDGISVRLVRDGSLEFSGQRLKTGPRIVLHSSFGKLLLKDQEMGLIAGSLQDDPRLDGLMVTQLVIDDGWIGLALGPASAERSAWRSPSSDSLTPFTR